MILFQRIMLLDRTKVCFIENGSENVIGPNKTRNKCIGDAQFFSALSDWNKLPQAISEAR